MSQPTATAFIELDASGDRIEVYFTAEPAIWRATKDAVKAVPGRLHKDGEHGPHWSVACDMRSARKLREIFTTGLTLGDAVKAWGREAASRERNLGKMAVADDHPLTEMRIARTAPELAAYLRPYQRADVALMATTNVLNANQPGTGKTVEVLAALHEADMTAGAHLVIAPVVSAENVWRPEIERWMPGTVYASEDPTARREAVREGLAAAARGETVWIVVNIEMVRVKLIKEDDTTTVVVRKDHKGRTYGATDDLHTEILGVNWTSLTIDEFHKMGIPERMSMATLGTDIIKADRRFLLSGTPMGGKPYKLFSPLRSIEPQKFSSFWRWAEEWLVVETEEIRIRGGLQRVNTVGGIKPGMEDKFYEAHAQHLVRRLKREALPGLPDKVRIIVPCGMTAKQAAQYAKFERDAEVSVGDGDDMIAADNTLAEFARLKQFANAYCTLDTKGRVVPTDTSDKLPLLLERLSEFGVTPIRTRSGKPLADEYQSYEPGARAIVASQSSRMVEMTAAWLTKQGIVCDTLTGDTKSPKPLIDRFNDGSDTPYVIVMTTQTGGVSINLEPASSVHILDESWNPDDEEQLEDRGDRGTRTTPLVCLYYRTTDTVQEYIAAVAEGKRITNKNVLDLARQIKKMRRNK